MSNPAYDYGEGAGFFGSCITEGSIDERLTSLELRSMNRWIASGLTVPPC